MIKKGSVIKYLIVMSIFVPLLTFASPPGQGIILYTPYISQSITPGKTLTYNIELLNNTSRIQNVNLSTRGIPSDWEPSLTAESNEIQKIAVKPKTSRSEEHTSELQSRFDLVCRLLLEKKKKKS